MKNHHFLHLGLLLFAVGLSHFQVTQAQSLSGTVFEDVNYGGGAGRTYAAANTAAAGFVSGSIRRPNARVELYNASGAFVTATTTDAAGLYSFSGLTSGANYTVRVVNSTVTSARPGSTAGLLPVQTFRTSAGVADAQRVGGENPALTDGAANAASVVVTGSTGTNNIALSFNGVPNSGDVAMFIDNVQVLQGSVPLGTNPIGNPGYESPSQGGGFTYNPGTTSTQAWTFTSLSGIQANGSAWGQPFTGSGTQQAFIQSRPAGTGVVSQSFTLPLGTYQISFAAANRQGYGTQTVNVLINGITVLANQQTGSAGYTTYVTQTFTVGPASTGGQALSALSAQSVAPVTATAGALTDLDFGFSFDVVTNTNDAGQGSVRQFLLNSNGLTNANLAQQGQVVGQETSIFMIPNGVAGGTAPAGLQRTPALASGLNGGTGANTWAQLQVLSALPTLTDAATALDATTQTTNIGNSNPGQVGTGGTVGTAAKPLALIDRPEVEIYGLSSPTNVVRGQGTSTVVRGLALHGAGNATLALNNALDFVVEKCLLGTSALAILDPTGLQPGSAAQLNLLITGVSRGLVRNNVVAFANSSGLVYNGNPGSGVVNVLSNEFVQNGYRTSGGDNITAGDNGNSGATGPLRIRANLIRSANSDGVQFEIGSFAGSNAITNNTFFDNGNGGLTAARSQLEGAAILYLQRTSGNTGSNNDSIAYNVINQSQASGVVVGYGQRGVIITRNSIYFNGTPFNSPTGSNLGIDLIAQASYYVGSPNAIGARDYGNGDGVTPNNGPASVSTAYGNAGMNYPIITFARVATQASTTVSVGGYVGSAAGQTAFAGATVDFYTADNVPANNAGPVLTGDGRQVAHGEGRTYLGSLTADASGNFAGTLTVPANTAPNTGAASTGQLTATATLVGAANYGTSEFGPNVPIIITADVYATITGVAGGVNASTTGTFTVQFGNQSTTGPVQADGVTAQVQLLPGLTGVTATSGGTYDPATGIISYAGYTGLPANSLASGASFSSVVSYPQPMTGALAATATILTTTNEGGLLTNNTATATNATNLLYDVTTTVAGPATAVQGAQVSYNVTTTNPVNPLFPSPAPQVVQTVSIPAGASNVYVTGGGVITGSSGAGFTVTYPALAALAPGQSVTNTVSFTAPASASFGVSGTVATSPTDGASGNNTSTATTTASAGSGLPANVYVTISPASSAVALNGAASLVVEQGNYGPNAAAGIQTTVLLPPGLPTSGANAPTLAGYTLSSFTATVATYTSGANTATYDATSGLFTLPAAGSQSSGSIGGAANSYTLGYVATKAGVFPATATVRTTTPDPVLGDNVASAEVTVNPGVADLSVALTGPTTVAAGEPLTYTMTTTNNGPADAQAVRQTVSILAGLGLTGPSAVRLNGALPTSVSGSVATYGTGPTAATYNTLTGIVTFPAAALPVLAVGSAVSNTITYLAPANGNTVLTNTAAVQSSSPDANLANNSASVAAPLQPVADVQVTISSTGFLTTNASGGNPILFGVSTVNNGPSTAPSAITTVELPTLLPITGSGSNVVRINGLLPSSTGGTGGLVATYTFPDGSSATYDSNTSANSLTPGRVTFSAQTNLTPGGSGIGATIGFAVPAGYIGQLVATARVAVGGVLDTDQSNNIALAQPILAPAVGSNDIVTTITASAATRTAGQPVTLTVTSNPGSGATGVLQYVQLPAGLTSGGGTVTVSGGPGGAVVTGGALSPNYDNASGLLTFPAILNLTAPTSYSVVISSVPGKGPLVATASITANELDANAANNVQVASVAITPSATLGLVVTGPATAPAGTVVTYLLAATNNGPTTATGVSQTLTLPAGVTAYSLNGGPLISIAGPGPTPITLPIPTTLVAGTTNTVSSTVSFLAPGAVGATLSVSSSLAATGPASTATVAAAQATAIISPPPIAFNVVNSLTSPEGNSAQAPLALSPLQAQPQGLAALNAATPYTILSLPLVGQGVLSLAGSPVTVGQTLTAAQAGQLRFLPASGFVGNAPFTYQALDNNGLVSNVARYLIPVGADNAAVYTATPVKGGATAYFNNDVIAFVIDPNGALYNGSGQIYQPIGATAGLPAPGTVNNGVQTTTTTGIFSSTTVPAITSLTLLGLTFNPATGQLTVIDRTKLRAGTYTVSMTTTDVRGGVTTLPVTFTIGNSPLPVELTAFTADAQGSAARLSWSTASEKNSARFEIERSADGRSFRRIGEVAAQGNSTAPTAYTYLDREAARVAPLVYYRLRQVDVDGTATYSPVRSVSFAKAAGLVSLALYPNPATASTTLDLSGVPAGTYQLTLVDAAGHLVRQLTMTGELFRALDVRDLAAGTYLVRLAGTTADGTRLSLSKRLTKE